ncbi:MAG: hypothetical protein ACXIUZ_13075 [Lysobacteraceae bacterium]
MNERLVEFGHGSFGILTLPEVPVGGPLVVLFNAGNMHRMGPFRMHVELARALARAGHAVLRWEQHRIGDALDPAPDSVVACAGDMLGRALAVSGCERAVVGGLCSASDWGWQLAQSDERVCGVLMLDGYARSGFWYRVGQAKLALGRSLRSWMKSLRKRLKAPRAAPAAAADFREWPARAEAPGQLQRLIDRGGRAFFLYTGGSADYFLMPRQFRRTWGAGALHPSVHFEHWPDCDHLFMLIQYRERLFEVLEHWLAGFRPDLARP